MDCGTEDIKVYYVYPMKQFFLTILLSSYILVGCTNSSNISNQQNPSQDEVFNSRFTADQLNNAPVKLIPFPQEVSWKKKKSKIPSLRIENPQMVNENLTEAIIEIVSKHGIQLSPKGKVTLSYQKNPDIPEEGYHLNISNDQIYIESSSESGTFYALQTFRQLIEEKNGRIYMQNCEIYDYPKYPVRGFMFDVGRNFLDLTSLKKQLDIMSKYKLNVFHWHLTDRPAWRIESHLYPELTAAENHRQTRDPGKYYTYDDIRELIEYAKQRSIQIIPEIDMPGHSDSFVTSMGVKMGSPEGMIILENILNEFFAEIPLESCPIIHLGSDEVQIPNPDQFIAKMVGICRAHDRQVMIWNPGLKADQDVIRQTWKAKHIEPEGYTEVDSWSIYTNNGEPMTHIARLFFKPIGYESENKVIGSIQCLWPDVNLDDVNEQFSTNPYYPALITFAWACWTADIEHPHPAYLTLLPVEGSQAANYFEAFELYLLDHKSRYFDNEPFPYYYQSDKKWKVALGNPETKEADLEWLEARGNTLIFKDRHKLGGYFPDASIGQYAIAETQIYSKSDQTVEVLIGFETPLRANRVYSGIPKNGSWDANGGKIWINGEELKGPEWEKPGWKPSRKSGWGNKSDQEIPWTKEELYWTRKPAVIQLKKGQNTIRFMAPYAYGNQNWMVTFIPLRERERK